MKPLNKLEQQFLNEIRSNVGWLPATDLDIELSKRCAKVAVDLANVGTGGTDNATAAVVSRIKDLGYEVEVISEAPKELQDRLSKIKEIPIIAPPVFELRQDPKTGRELRRERRKRNKDKTFTQSLKKKG